MPDDADQHPEPFYAAPRRREMLIRLIEEGAIADKSPKELTEADFDLIDSRLLLEDTAATEGISVDEMIDAWERELATAQAFESVEEVIAWLHDNAASEPTK